MAIGNSGESWLAGWIKKFSKQNLEKQVVSPEAVAGSLILGDEVEKTLTQLAQSSDPEQSLEYKTLETLEESVDQALLQYDDVTRLSKEEQHAMNVLLAARSNIASFFIRDEMVQRGDALIKPTEADEYVVTHENRQKIFQVVIRAKNLKQLQEELLHHLEDAHVKLSKILTKISLESITLNVRLNVTKDQKGVAASKEFIAAQLDKIADYSIKRRVTRLVNKEIQRLSEPTT